MGDDERGAALHHLAQGRADLLLHAGVNARGRVVEDEDARLHEDGPGNRDALALPAGKREPLLANDGVVAFGQPGDEIVGVSEASGALDLLVGRVHPPVGDVVPDSVGKEEGVFEDNADVPAQVVEAQFTHIRAIDLHRSGFGFVEAREQAGDG